MPKERGGVFVTPTRFGNRSVPSSCQIISVSIKPCTTVDLTISRDDTQFLCHQSIQIVILRSAGWVLQKVDELGKSLGNVSPISGGLGPGYLERRQFSLYNAQPSDRNHPAALDSPLEDVQITSGRYSSPNK